MEDKLCPFSPDCYTKALMDVLALFERHDISFKHDRCYNHKHIHAILVACIEYREILRKWGGYAEISVRQEGKKPIYMLKDPK
jgi:hypothetical protein